MSDEDYDKPAEPAAPGPDEAPTVEQAVASPPASERRQAYWRANIKLIAVLLSIWAIVSTP